MRALASIAGRVGLSLHLNRVREGKRVDVSHRAKARKADAAARYLGDLKPLEKTRRPVDGRVGKEWLNWESDLEVGTAMEDEDFVRVE